VTRNIVHQGKAGNGGGRPATRWWNTRKWRRIPCLAGDYGRIKLVIAVTASAPEPAHRSPLTRQDEHAAAVIRK
jgi:hypothetical protein